MIIEKDLKNSIKTLKRDIKDKKNYRKKVTFLPLQKIIDTNAKNKDWLRFYIKCLISVKDEEDVVDIEKFINSVNNKWSRLGKRKLEYS